MTGSSRPDGASVPGRLATLILIMVATPACTGDPTEPGSFETFQLHAAGMENGVQIMTQNVLQGAVMDAKFEGTVIADDDGCLRLMESDGPTVVWLMGYTGEIGADGISILDGNGNVAGHVGGSFSFGGGSVPELHQTLGLTHEGRDPAAQTCPGRFSIVAH